MCIPKSNHKKLIDECYPAPKALATCGPDYRPNSNEVSRLAYYASSKPAKLTKVGSNLQAKAAKDASGVRGSGPASDKAKGGLMVTLAITKYLITECKRQLNYFHKSAQAIIASGLEAASTGGPNGQRDQELFARAASTFYALATFTDPATTSLDQDLGRTYQDLLSQFSKLAMEKSGKDEEEKSRNRLIGIGALSGAVGSDALYTTSFVKQAGVIIPALLSNVQQSQVTLDFLDSETSKAAHGTPSLAAFSIKRRPVDSRRAPSIRGHVDGEKGPTSEDVASASIGTLQGLMSHGDASHVQATVSAALSWLDGKSTGQGSQWENKEWCCWLAGALSSWSALQYRFVVLSSLVEHLVETCDGPALAKHQTLIGMIHSLLTGKQSLIGLSTSDTLNNLVGLAVRRVHQDTRDVLLPSLVECVSGLGTHTYYADQINDIAEEICARIVALQLPEVDAAETARTAHGGRKQTATTSGPEQKSESIRVLLFCLNGVMNSAHRSNGEVQKAVDNGSAEKGKASAGDGLALARAGTRNRITPDVFAQTAALLASSNATVRLMYEQVLLSYFKTEVNPGGSSGSEFLGGNTGAQLCADAIGFGHSFSAAAYVLALSKTLYGPNSVRESPLEALPIIDRSNADEGRALAADSSTSAVPLDYVALASLLEEMLEKTPVPALLATVPMIIALDKNAGSRLVSSASSSGAEGQRRLATRAVISRAYSKIAQVWGISSLSGVGSGQIRSDSLGELPPAPEELAVGAAGLPFSGSSNGEGSAATFPLVDGKSVVDALSRCNKIQSSTSLDEATLKQWFGRDWSVSIAVDDCESPSQEQNLAWPRHPILTPLPIPPLLAFIGASPYHEEGQQAAIPAQRTGNPSAVSLSRADESERGVGVDDLRQALGSRSYASNTNQTSASGASMNSGTDRRASRRVSRKISGAQASTPNSYSVGGLLDSMHVGVPEEKPMDQQNGGPTLVAPYAA